jgi:hypothetical protein
MITNARMNTNRSKASRLSKNMQQYNNIPKNAAGVNNSLPSGRSEINRSSGGTRKGFDRNQHDSFQMENIDEHSRMQIARSNSVA